jgi:exodeoxyribonuclease VII large subunit
MSFSPVPDGGKVISVGELTRTIKAVLEESFPWVWVSGEISNLARPTSGHIYLTLKDAEAQLRAVIYRSSALRLRFEPQDGLEVIVRGRLSVYPPRGEYQLLIEELQPKGLGARELALRQLKEKLVKLGYFEPGRKKPLPPFPKRIALVTSPSGAAVRDMLEILGRRWPSCEVYVCPARMQGDGAAQEIAGAVHFLNRLHRAGTLKHDVLILGRGGGSSEDLWAFNEEIVAHAIYQSAIPVVSAVGHEIDMTIADLVADRRALTPSEAATAVVPDRGELLFGLSEFRGRLRAAVLERLQERRGRLEDLAGRRAFRLPLESIRDQERRLDDWSERLGRAMEQRLQAARQRIQAFSGQLASLSPLNVLGRGYSLTRREVDQAVVRASDQVQPGDRIVTIVQQGQIVSRVEELEPPGAAASLEQGCSRLARMRP